MNSFLEKNNIIYAATNAGIFYSADSGRTWPNFYTQGFGEVFTVANIDTAIFAATQTGIYIFDEKGVAIGEHFNQQINLILAVGSNLYAAIQDILGVFSSSDNWATWSQPVKQYCIYCFYSLGNIIFAGGSNVWDLRNSPEQAIGILYISTDNGKSWTDQPIQLPSAVRSLTSFGTTLFAGTHDGVYISNDSGFHWEKTKGENPPSPILSLIEQDGYLYAGTGQNSIWRHPVSQFLTVKNESFALAIHNYPNPCTEKISIAFSLPKDDFVTLKIYNVLGKETAVLADKLYEAGSHQIEWNSEGLPSGIYYCQLRAGSLIETSQMAVCH